MRTLSRLHVQPGFLRFLALLVFLPGTYFSTGAVTITYAKRL